MKRATHCLDVGSSQIHAHHFPSLKGLKPGRDMLAEQREHQQGYEQGLSQGMAEGLAQGKSQGIEQGQRLGFDQGYEQESHRSTNLSQCLSNDFLKICTSALAASPRANTTISMLTIC